MNVGVKIKLPFSRIKRACIVSSIAWIVGEVCKRNQSKGKRAREDTAGFFVRINQPKSKRVREDQDRAGYVEPTPQS